MPPGCCPRAVPISWLPHCWFLLQCGARNRVCYYTGSRRSRRCRQWVCSSQRTHQNLVGSPSPNLMHTNAHARRRVAFITIIPLAHCFSLFFFCFCSVSISVRVYDVYLSMQLDGTTVLVMFDMHSWAVWVLGFHVVFHAFMACTTLLAEGLGPSLLLRSKKALCVLWVGPRLKFHHRQGRKDRLYGVFGMAILLFFVLISSLDRRAWYSRAGGALKSGSEFFEHFSLLRDAAGVPES